MAATIVVTCPECKKQLKGPAELQGRRIRCKACGHTFTVAASPPRKAESDSPPPKAKPTPKAKPDSPSPKAKAEPVPPPPKAKAAPKATDVPKGKADPRALAFKEDKEAKNPYQLGDVSLRPRCPQCAAEMESEDAIICIECGYNTQTRSRLTTKMTIETTSSEWAMWLLPGILCAVVVLIMLSIIAFLWFGLPSLAGDAWWGHFSIQVWGSVFAAFGGWFAGKFAFKRLVLNPRPPETPLK